MNSKPKVIQSLYFVGIHFKPNVKKALCPDTKTGKIVTSLISTVPGNVECFRTNLCQCNYPPKHLAYWHIWAKDWHNLYKPRNEDIIVLLGLDVQRYFHRAEYENIIEIAHPASLYAAVDILNYINQFEKMVELLLDVPSKSFSNP